MNPVPSYGSKTTKDSQKKYNWRFTIAVIALLLLIFELNILNSRVNDLRAKVNNLSAQVANPLKESANQTQVVYDSLVAYAKSTHKTNANLGTDFVNAHKSWFTTKFILYTHSVSTKATNNYLVCADKTFLENVWVIADSGDDQTTKTRVAIEVIDTAGNTSSVVLPVTLKFSGQNWAIDSVDLSSCKV